MLPDSPVCSAVRSDTSCAQAGAPQSEMRPNVDTVVNRLAGSLHSKATHTAGTTSCLVGLALHLLRDLDVDFEEL